MATAATAIGVPTRKARIGVSKLPIPNPATVAVAPERSATTRTVACSAVMPHAARRAAQKSFLRYALEPLRGGLQRLALATVTRVAEKRAMLRTPRTILRAMIPDAHEVTVRARGGLIDTADASRTIGRFPRTSLRGLRLSLRH